MNEAIVSRKEQAAELIVFLLLIVPSMILSFFMVKTGKMSFLLTAYATIFRDLSLVSLVLFFLWRNGEPVSSMGWDFKHIGKEAAIGIALYVPLFISIGLIGSALQSMGLSAPTRIPGFLTPKGPVEVTLGFLMVVVVAIAEETLFRGYLILRFVNLTGSLPAAVLISAAVFSIGHGYEGSAGVVTVGLLGLAFALVYIWRKSLVAPMVMHFLQDFLGIVLVPLFR